MLHASNPDGTESADFTVSPSRVVNQATVTLITQRKLDYEVQKSIKLKVGPNGGLEYDRTLVRYSSNFTDYFHLEILFMKFC